MKHKAILHEGVWLPATEKHFIEMMTPGAKRFQRDSRGRATYQWHKLQRFMHFIPTDRRRNAVDVGAHVGLWSMHLVELFDWVDAFEPVPFFCDLFVKNLKPAENFQLWGFAVGERDDRVQLRIPLGQTGATHIDTGEAHPRPKYDASGDFERVTVDMVTLDSLALLPENPVDFIKIDVEGYERQVLEGARETIARDKPYIVIEQKGNEAAFGDSRNAALELLRSWGAVPLDHISGDHLVGWP